ncbi:MAG: hypothetical protein ABJH52_14650 [Henriciella sp.]
MSIAEKIQQLLADRNDQETQNLDTAEIREAERLADLFDSVKPVPYVVPIERYAGLPVFREKEPIAG